MENEVQYCVACHGKFAQKFSFCPDCGAQSTTAGATAAGVATGTAAVSPSSELVQNESGYRVTIVREKNVKLRNWLLFGAVTAMLGLGAGGTVYSIFNKKLDVAAVDTGDLFSFIADVDPVTFDPAEDLKKEKQKAGGGGGGNGDKTPVQKGREATQTDDPLFSPSKTYTPLTNPEIKIRAATKGTKQTPQADEPYGLNNNNLIPSDGEGCCGGQGNSRAGRGGQGNDPGAGLGPGKDAGPGGGGTSKDGGKTDPDNETDIPKVKTVTTALKILSKPRATYTDAAREKLVQGRVVLRVTFLASGGIGAVTVVSGLAGGLTEQAVAAARSIKFEPARVNGTAVAVTRTIEYTFSIF